MKERKKILKKLLEETDKELKLNSRYTVKYVTNINYYNKPHLVIKSDYEDEDEELIYLQFDKCDKDAIIELIHLIKNSKDFNNFSKLIYRINELYGRDDDLYIRKNGLEYEIINNVGTECAGNTFYYKITKENILEILEWIIKENLNIYYVKN